MKTKCVAIVILGAKLLLRRGRGAEYCNQFVCLSVREHISGTAGPLFTKFVLRIPSGRGSILWQHCDMLCTSGFMDDVTFGCSGPYGDAWKAEHNLLSLLVLQYWGGV